MHRTLSPLLSLPQRLDRRIGFVTAQKRNRYKWIKSRFIRQVVSHGAVHVGMTLNVLRDTTSEMFLIFEHKADYSIPLYFLLLLKGKPVFFFVHDMHQSAALKLRSKIALHICRFWVRLGEFYPIFIAVDDAVLGEKSRFSIDKTLVIPHPHHLAEGPRPARPKRIASERLRVGMIETTRKEKSIRHLVTLLQSVEKKLDFQLLIGAPFHRKPAWLEDSSFEVVDTSTEAQFSNYLRSLDIFVVDFVRAEYLFRPSGAVVDAGMNGCYVICPDFPVFCAQINIPVSIGSTFSSLAQIPQVLEESMQKLRNDEVDFETWRRYHRIDNIVLKFKDFLENRRR